MVEHSEVMRFAAWLDDRLRQTTGLPNLTLYADRAERFIEETYVNEPQSAIDAVVNMDAPSLSEAVSVGQEFIDKAEALGARVDALDTSIRVFVAKEIDDLGKRFEKRAKSLSANLTLTNNKLELLTKEVKRADTLGAVLDCIGSGDIPGAVGAIRAQNDNPSITIHAERNEPETLGDSQVDAVESETTEARDDD
jgi:hypothetical protein